MCKLIERQEGKVVFFNKQDGYGFIRSNNLDTDAYFNLRDVNGGVTIQIGLVVSFVCSETLKGYRALDVGVVT